MPTVPRFDGLRVVIYPNDHSPQHVHVIGKGHEAVFNLNGPAGPIEIRENYGFSRPAVRHIASALATHLQALCRAWENIHGEL